MTPFTSIRLPPPTHPHRIPSSSRPRSFPITTTAYRYYLYLQLTLPAENYLFTSTGVPAASSAQAGVDLRYRQACLRRPLDPVVVTGTRRCRGAGHRLRPSWRPSPLGPRLTKYRAPSEDAAVVGDELAERDVLPPRSLAIRSTGTPASRTSAILTWSSLENRFPISTPHDRRTQCSPIRLDVALTA